MAKRERVMRMSVEQPLWRALTGYRVLTMLYAIGLFAAAHEELHRPWVAIAYYVVLAGWTLGTLRCVANAASCATWFLVVDLAVALVGILLTPVADAHQRIVDGGPTLPSIWTAGAVLAYAIKGGWRWAAFASLLVGVANVVQRGAFSRDTIHNVLLVCIASIAIGYVVEVARASERTLARALEIEATTRERERLARDIHDSVLQVLAMEPRRGTRWAARPRSWGGWRASRRWRCARWWRAAWCPPRAPRRTPRKARSYGPSRNRTTIPAPPTTRRPGICARSSPRTPGRR